MSTRATHYDPREIKRRLPMLDLLAQEGVAVRRDGPHWKALCPFHEERSGSFTIYTYANSEEDHAHCFGCGWNGDAIDFWRERRGGDFFSALQALASLASVSPSVFEAKRKVAEASPRVTEVTRETRKKPSLPRFRALAEAEIETLAKLRKLNVNGVAAAAADKRVGACAWPQFERDYGREMGSVWTPFDDATVCWVVTDHTRNLAQFRRLDGEGFVRNDGKEIKAWTKGSPTWPLGAAEIGPRAAVLMVEGGADMLAAYHFLAMFRRLDDVAVCAMLGASCCICESALPFFARKRVRLFMHGDAPKDGEEKVGKARRKRVLPGSEAAARWTAQLTSVGAAVETFCVGDQYVAEDLKRWRNYEIGAAEVRIETPAFMMKNGEACGDLNDLAEVDEAAWLDPELREAFFDFDF